MSQSYSEPSADTRRLGTLLASNKETDRAQAKRILEQTESDPLRLLRQAAEYEQTLLQQRANFLNILFLVSFTVVRYTDEGLKAVFGKNVAWYWDIPFILLFLVVPIVFVRRISKSLTNYDPLRAVAFEMVRRNDPFVGRVLASCWHISDNQETAQPVEQSLTDWFTQNKMAKPDKVFPEWLEKFCQEARGAFQVRKRGRRVVSVQPNGAFWDSRADLLVTLFQYLLARPDIQTPERRKERELIHWAAQLQGTTENHAFVRDAAQALLQGKSAGIVAGKGSPATVPMTVTPTAISTITPTVTPPPTQTVLHVGQRQP